VQYVTKLWIIWHLTWKLWKHSTSDVNVRCSGSSSKIEFGTRVSISLRNRLQSISDLICKRRSSVFCHVVRLPASAPAHQALKLQVDLSLNRFPNTNWKRHSGCPHDILHQYNHSPADLWRSTFRRGHSGVTLGPRWLRVDDDDDVTPHPLQVRFDATACCLWNTLGGW